MCVAVPVIGFPAGASPRASPCMRRSHEMTLARALTLAPALRRAAGALGATFDDAPSGVPRAAPG